MTTSIDATEKFDPDNYPLVVAELMALKKGISSFPSTYRPEMIISYLKDHALKNIWIDANPSLTKLLTSRRMQTAGIESFLESAKRNSLLLNDFEGYVRTVI
jgi:hypothetical protein